jgi:sulfate adenylyltransferase
MTSEELIRPHGGPLVNRVASRETCSAALEAAAALPAVRLTPVQHSDLLCIATGDFTPLIGFAARDDYESILEPMRLTTGVVWTIPITLSVSAETAKSLRSASRIALEDPSGRLVATMDLTDQFAYDKAREAKAVYRTTDAAHPGVARLYGQGDVLLAGPVMLLERPANEPFAACRRDPAETRRLFAEHSWRRVVGFQTRNPVHRAHGTGRLVDRFLPSTNRWL